MVVLVPKILPAPYLRKVTTAFRRVRPIRIVLRKPSVMLIFQRTQFVTGLAKEKTGTSVGVIETAIRPIATVKFAGRRAAAMTTVSETSDVSPSVHGKSAADCHCLPMHHVIETPHAKTVFIVQLADACPHATWNVRPAPPATRTAAIRSVTRI